MLSASYRTNLLWMLLPLLLVTLHFFLGERTAYSLPPDLSVLLNLNTQQTSLRQEPQVQFQVALVFRNKERAAIRDVTLSIRGPQNFNANLPMVKGGFDLSGIQGVAGTFLGTVSTHGVTTPLPSLYKSNSTGGAILIDALWSPGDNSTVGGNYVAQVVVELEDESNPLSSKQIEFALVQPTPTPTLTPTPTSTSTTLPTATPTPSSTPTLTPAPTSTSTTLPAATPTLSSTPALTPTPTFAMPPTATPTPIRPTRTPQPTRTKTPTPTKTASPTSTPTATYTPIPAQTDTATPTTTPTLVHTAVPTIPFVPIVMDTPMLTQAAIATYKPEPTANSAIVVQTATATPTASITPTPTNVPTSTPTAARLPLMVNSSDSSRAELPSSKSLAGRLVKSSSMRIFPTDPSKPLVLIVDGYTVSTSTPSATLPLESNDKSPEIRSAVSVIPSRTSVLVALVVITGLLVILYHIRRRRSSASGK